MLSDRIGRITPSATLEMTAKAAELRATGIDVINLGKLPTPLNYYSMYTDKFKVDAAIQITGSHNPSDYNGFKITYGKKPFYGEDIQLLYNMIFS